MFLQIQGIQKSFGAGDSRVDVLKGLDLDIERGEFCVLLGPSGSGKSTLLNIIGGIDSADEGNLVIDGERLADMSEKNLSLYRRKHLGYIFQMYNLIPNLTALENVELPLIYRGISKKERLELSQDALRKVGLEKRMNHKPSEMSGGQQQRVAVARAIAARPPLILADEPTGNLDSRTSGEIMEILKGLHRAGRTVVIITHDLDIAAQARRVICIRDGQIEREYENRQQ